MALISKNYTFTAGNTIAASEHNSNFDTIYNDYNGNITNANLSNSAAIANSKLASPNAYFTICVTKSGQYTSSVDPIATFQMFTSATLVEVSACARLLDTADGNETYAIDIEEGGVSVLSSAISLTASNTPVVGTVSDSSIADNAKIEISLTLGGTSPALDDLTVLMTFKTGHIS